jgi:hypothetical protein
MKKYIASLVMMAMLAVSIPMLAGTASAQRRYDGRRYSQQNYDYGYQQPNVYDKHRKAVNIAAGTVAGALLGALLGGKKGALIGAGVGAVGGIVVTKKQAPRNYSRYRY